MLVVNIMLDFKRLKDLREDHDLTQSEMAEILGVKRSTYSLWELGINIIPLSKLSVFADYFKCSLDYVLGLSNQKRSYELIEGIDFKIVGSNLKKIRLSNKLSQENIASLLNISQACITKYEKGLIEISITNIYEFAKYFKISINDLCGKTKEKVKLNN